MYIYIKEDDITDIDKLDDYFAEYKKVYPDFIPYTSKETYNDFLNILEKKKDGIENGGIKEHYYYAIENNKIIGHGSIRLNPDIDERVYKESGHIMYGVIPSKRCKGYGTIICSLLLEKANEIGLNKVIITCYENNIGSKKIIEKMYGNYLETIVVNDEKIVRYEVTTIKKIIQ